MSDLISRSAFIEYAKERLDICCDDLIGMIIEQPTVEAIPKEKLQEIVDRLEEQRFDYYEELEIDIVDGIDQAIEIVKEVGGMNG